MVEEKDERRITVRVSPALYDQVVGIASERNLSLNGFIITLLEKAARGEDDLERRIAALEAIINGE